MNVSLPNRTPSWAVGCTNIVDKSLNGRGVSLASVSGRETFEFSRKLGLTHFHELVEHEVAGIGFNEIR